MLVLDGQDLHPIKRYLSSSMSIRLIAAFVTLSVLIVTISGALLLASISDPVTATATKPAQKATLGKLDTWLAVRIWFEKGLPVVAVIAVAAFGASHFNIWRTRRDIAFQLLEELHSKEFERTRHFVVQDASRALAGLEVLTVTGWLPIDGLTGDFSGEADDFSKQHSVSKMIHFILRIALYEAHDMVEISLIRHAFHGFFSHYELFLLEWCSAFRQARRTHIHAQHFDERWELIPDKVESFLASIGLAARLRGGHHYLFFKYLNDRPMA